jgi:hypothetical protein
MQYSSFSSILNIPYFNILLFAYASSQSKYETTAQSVDTAPKMTTILFSFQPYFNA